MARRVPWRLRIRILFGGQINHLNWGVTAFFVWMFALIGTNTDPAEVPSDDSLTPAEVPILLLAFVGLAVLVWLGLAIYNLRTFKLLAHGLTVNGILINAAKSTDSEYTGALYTFRYEVDGKDYEVSIDTTDDVPRLEDDVAELMVYLKERPDNAFPIDHLPGTPTIDADGVLRARDPRVWPALILPGLTLAGVLFWFAR